MANSKWIDAPFDPFLSMQRQQYLSSPSSIPREHFKIDRSRRPMVAVMVGPLPKQRSSLSDSLINIDIVAEDDHGSTTVNRKYAKMHSKTKTVEKSLTFEELSIKNVDHSDVNRERDKKYGELHSGNENLNQNQSQVSMCFGCWSSGNHVLNKFTYEARREIKYQETRLYALIGK